MENGNFEEARKFNPKLNSRDYLFLTWFFSHVLNIDEYKDVGHDLFYLYKVTRKRPLLIISRKLFLFAANQSKFSELYLYRTLEKYGFLIRLNTGRVTASVRVEGRQVRAVAINLNWLVSNFLWPAPKN